MIIHVFFVLFRILYLVRDYSPPSRSSVCHHRKSFYLYEERRVGTDTAVDVMMSDIYLVYIEVNNIKGFCQKQVYLVTLVPKTGTF